jgi:putative pyoverdin transport system ATP-binding/permease protein
MLTLIRFLRRETDIGLPRLVVYAAIAGISNALILGILNVSAGAAAKGEASGSMLALFGAACLTYWVTQRHLFLTTMAHIEGALHRYRMAQVTRVLHSDLDALERIGPARIFGALTRQTQTISTAAGPIVLGVQSVVIIVFTLIYLSLLSVDGALLTVLILGVALTIARIRWTRAYRTLHEVTRHENDLFDSTTDLIEGFKEVRLNADRSRDISRHVEEISQEVTRLKGDIDRRLSQLFLFSQISFFVAAAAMIFVLPGLSSYYPHDLLKTTTVIIFLVGPVSSVTGSSTAIAQAAAAVATLFELEAALQQAAGRSEPTGAKRTDFSEIRLRDVVYQHGVEEGGSFTLGPVGMELRKGELIFIMGGNGSGKTTLLKILTALYLPHSGVLTIDGEPVDAASREGYQSLFSAIFADFHLFHRPFGLRGLDPARFEPLLAEMGLAGKIHLVDGRFDTIKLSTGQRKRLAMIIALIEDRPIFIFDEWAADQDPVFRRKFYDEILPSLHARGKTIVAVTHDERFLDRAERVLVMEEGRLAQARAAAREPPTPG